MITIPKNISSTCDIDYYSNIHDKNNENFKSGKFIYEPLDEKICFLHMRNQKGADLLRGNRIADQRLCFCYIDSTIPLPPKYEV